MTTDGLPLWVTIPGTLLLFTGGLAVLVGSLGLLRLPTFYARMHGPSMGNTLGSGCVLIASMIVGSALLHRVVIHELLITLFIVISSPATAMLLMRAAVYRTGVRMRRKSDTPEFEQLTSQVRAAARAKRN